jgi:MprA protease rhombosortase-interaction domain-containing protein
MNWLDAVCFLPLAFICNTALPVPFDPVLIYFASHHDSKATFFFAAAASICAGLAAVAETGVLKSLGSKIGFDDGGQFTRTSSFYFFAMLVALLPLPFSIVRLAVLRNPPKRFPYGLAVVLGRFPRYLVTAGLWHAIHLPSWTAVLLLIGASGFALRKKMLEIHGFGNSSGSAGSAVNIHRAL